ncbi:hypothetical protein B0I33_103467 [Prauserella shujinwangii]|uniref:Uncharacterized protein n=1 Tax=Prauserella shujinwangii TaxID=1453103 RepID=A0A2T0LZA7_9PSEU|nr:hypothetical protein [Prauserella shujinwangii]PRX49430.1 hypothetical protein B0I33_103467 [Prauserella shujinwangii]
MTEDERAIEEFLRTFERRLTGSAAERARAKGGAGGTPVGRRGRG